LNDPNRKDKERAVNVQLAEETVRLAKELYGIDLPFEDDDLSSDEDTLNKLIDFARLGSFTRVGTNGAEAGSLLCAATEPRRMASTVRCLAVVE